MACAAPYAHHCPKTCPAAPLRHARRAPLEHTAGASARERFTRAPPARGRITRAARAAHVGMRHVVGLQDAPAHCPATGGAAGSRSASSVRYRRATSGPLCGRIQRAEASRHRLRRAPRTWQLTVLRGTAREQLGGLGTASEAEEVQVQTVDTLIGTGPESKGSYVMSMGVHVLQGEASAGGAAHRVP